jgi:cystathionine beta-synthase
MAGAIKFARERPEAKTIVLILPDSGSRYLSKVYDDRWLRQNDFLEEDLEGKVADLMDKRRQQVISAQASDSVRSVIGLMKKHGISQLPVLDGEQLTGMISEGGLLGALLGDPAAAHRPVGALAEPNYEVTEPAAPISRLSDIISRGKVALVVEKGRLRGVITKFDLIEYLAATR